MAGASALATLASTGVQIFGAISGAKQQAFRDKFDASVARTNASEADTAYRTDMMRQISNIKAVRASAGMGQKTPTFQNYVSENRDVADKNRHKRVWGFNQQGLMSEGDAAMATRLGWLKAIGIGVSGLAGMT